MHFYRKDALNPPILGALLSRRAEPVVPVDSQKSAVSKMLRKPSSSNTKALRKENK